MFDEEEILASICDMSPRERAAAISHRVYMMAGQLIPEWQLRVPANWNDLAPEAKGINLAMNDVWIQHEKLLEAWIEAIKAFRVAQCSEGKDFN